MIHQAALVDEEQNSRESIIENRAGGERESSTSVISDVHWSHPWDLPKVNALKCAHFQYPAPLPLVFWHKLGQAVELECTAPTAVSEVVGMNSRALSLSSCGLGAF